MGEIYLRQRSVSPRVSDTPRRMYSLVIHEVGNERHNATEVPTSTPSPMTYHFLSLDVE